MYFQKAKPRQILMFNQQSCYFDDILASHNSVMFKLPCMGRVISCTDL